MSLRKASVRLACLVKKHAGWTDWVAVYEQGRGGNDGAIGVNDPGEGRHGVVVLQFGPVDLPLRRIAGDFDLKRLGVAEHALRFQQSSVAQMQIEAVTGLACDLQRFGCQHLAKVRPRQIYVLQTDRFLLLRLRQIHIGRCRSS